MAQPAAIPPFTAEGPCPASPQEFQKCLLHFICGSPTFGPFPASAVGLNADIRRAYQRAGHSRAALGIFKAGNTGDAIRAILADLQKIGCGSALVLDDAAASDDLLILDADRWKIHSMLLAPKMAIRDAGLHSSAVRQLQNVPGCASDTARSGRVTCGEGTAPPVSSPLCGSGRSPQRVNGPSRGSPLNAHLAMDSDDELARLLAEPTVKRKDWEPHGFRPSVVGLAEEQQAKEEATACLQGVVGDNARGEIVSSGKEARERGRRHRRRKRHDCSSSMSSPGEAGNERRHRREDREQRRQRHKGQEHTDVTAHEMPSVPVHELQTDFRSGISDLDTGLLGQAPSSPWLPPPGSTFVFDPDNDTPALQPEDFPLPEPAPRRTVSEVPLFEWVSADSLSDLKTSTRGRGGGRSRSRGGSRTVNDEQGSRAMADGKCEKPEKLAGEAWEQPRETTGLKLIGESGDKAWVYPLVDESRRSFVGFLRSQLSVADSQGFFQRIREGTEWKQPEGPMGALPRKTCFMVSNGCKCTYRYGGIEVAPQEFPPWMMELMQVTMPLCGLNEVRDWPNSCNLNLYDDGGMSVGWHADDERLFQGKFFDCCIISLSLGARRKFELRLNWPEEGERLLWQVFLGDGDLLTMEGMTQKHFQHRVPREDNVSAPRINLTWRWVSRHGSRCPVERRRHP